MRAQQKATKSQRPISSFFAPKPQPQRAEPAPAAAAAPDVSLDKDADPRPAKRLRVGSSTVASPALTGCGQQPNSRAGRATGQGGSPAAGGPLPTDTACPSPAHQAQPAARGQPASQAVAPAAQAGGAQQHERWQAKLVAGEPLTRRSSAVGSQPDIVQQKYTPLELQIVELKRKHPGVLLIIEVGYKMRFFGEDADIAARVCNIFCYPDRNFMTASVPVPRLHVYVRRLVQAGYKVGVVRQAETAALKKAGANRYAPFQRTLSALYTAATLEAGEHEHVGEEAGDGQGAALLSSYLLALVEAPCPGPPGGSAGAVEIGLVAVETSTGDVLYDQFKDGLLRGELESRLMTVAPSELLVAQPLSPASQRVLGACTSRAPAMRTETVPAGKYAEGGGLAAITQYYAAAGGDPGAGLAALERLPPLAVQALAHALDYLRPFGLEAVLRPGGVLRPFAAAHELALPPNALRQLEVLQNTDDGSVRGSLLWLLDHTRTAPGARLLRSWITHPLRDRKLIEERLDAVVELAAAAGGAGGGLGGLAAALAGLPDLERGLTRILHRTASPAQYVESLRALASVATRLGLLAPEAGEVEGEAAGAAAGPAEVQSALLRRHLQVAGAAAVADAARDMLAQVDAAAAQQNDRINLLTSEACFPEVFACKREVARCEAALAGLLPALRRQLRLPRLEYVSIMNQGDFLLEVPADRKDVPKDWQLVCSTKKVHRYLPAAVREAAAALELARERLAAAASQAWDALLASFLQHYGPMRQAVAALAALDALLSLAEVAARDGYTRPQLVGEEEPAQVVLQGGRHPVLDASLPGAVVPNDTCLRGDGQRCAVITGPNMGGKSCYIRSVALIVIMAQVGSFVPAASARLHVVDAVYTRMGASDNLAAGRSTFLQELGEAGALLAAATPRSLVILDELGRGTSTHDGVAIAAATLHYLVTTVKCLTLFVTHYPQVAGLQLQLPADMSAFYMDYLQDQPVASPRACRQSMAGEEGAEKVAAAPRITFLYKLAPGIADRSFGLNVARMAELPESVVDRAAVKAAEMEAASCDADHTLQTAQLPSRRPRLLERVHKALQLEQVQATYAQLRHLQLGLQSS